MMGIVNCWPSRARLQLVVLVACGGSPPPAPVTTPPLMSSVAGAPTTRAPEAPAASEPTFDENAPVTPPKTYDPEQCTTRVATFARRAMAAFEFSDRSNSLASRTLFADRADPTLSAPLVIWIEHGRGMEGEFCGSWRTEVIVNGKTVASFEGKQRNAKTLAAIKKRLANGGTIGVQLSPYLSMDTIAPFLVELQQLGPLALSVAVQGDDFAIPLDDAPAWARERLRAYLKSPSMKIISTGIRDSAMSCPAHKAANDKILADEVANKAFMIATEYPKAVAACACTNIDVDALEAFTVAMIAGGRKDVTEGFLDMKIDPGSATKVTAQSSELFGAGLAKLTREQRRSGIALETGGAPEGLARCK